MLVNEKYTLIDISTVNSFYMTKFNKQTKKVNNNIDILTTVYFTSIVKNSVIDMIKRFNLIYYGHNNYFTGKQLFEFLKIEFNLNMLEISYHNFKVICNMLLDGKRVFSYDINYKQLDSLYLYDLKYYNKKSKINLYVKNINNKHFIILNINGHDKTYNILLCSHKKDIIELNKRVKINSNRIFEKNKKYFKQNKYQYNNCKNKVLRKKEYDIIRGKKYGHNFKNKTNKEYVVKKTYIDLIIEDLIYYYDNNYNFKDSLNKNYYDLIELYYNKYDLNDLKNDLNDYKTYLFDMTKNDHDNKFNIDYLLRGKQIKVIKKFIEVINLYEYRKNKEDLKTDLNDYDNYNYNLKDYFIYYNSHDKI